MDNFNFKPNTCYCWWFWLLMTRMTYKRDHCNLTWSESIMFSFVNTLLNYWITKLLYLFTNDLVFFKHEHQTNVARTQTQNNRPEAAAHRASQPTSSEHFPLASCSRRAAKCKAAGEALVKPGSQITLWLTTQTSQSIHWIIHILKAVHFPSLHLQPSFTLCVCYFRS